MLLAPAGRQRLPLWTISASGARRWLGALARAGGGRELLDDPQWSGKLDWLDRNSFKRSGHRPDLVGFISDKAILVEVELATKSKPRLDAILKLHLGWIIAQKTNGVIHILRR